MTNTQKIVGAIIAGIVVGLLFSWVTNKEDNLGGVYTQVNSTFREGIKVGTSDEFSVSSAGAITTTGTVKVGSNGSTVTELKATTCDVFIDGGLSVGASSTVSRTCTVTGVATGDMVFAQFPTTTSNGAMGWHIVGATAMDGVVGLTISNTTGAAGIIPAAIASATRILYIDN